jgi:Flp pilus assembly pilin Flp
MSEAPERGRPEVGFTEYVLIIAIVAVIVIGALVLLGPTLANLIKTLTDNLFTP